MPRYFEDLEVGMSERLAKTISSSDVVGFAEIKKFEEEFLPSDEVAKKYAGAVGFHP